MYFNCHIYRFILLIVVLALFVVPAVADNETFSGGDPGITVTTEPTVVPTTVPITIEPTVFTTVEPTVVPTLVDVTPVQTEVPVVEPTTVVTPGDVTVVPTEIPTIEPTILPTPEESGVVNETQENMQNMPASSAGFIEENQTEEMSPVINSTRAGRY